LLKLANVKAIDRKMTPFFEPISYVMQVGTDGLDDETKSADNVF
jgi:hypothetical protein